MVEAATVPVTPNKGQVIANTTYERGTIGKESIPSTEEVLRLIATKYFCAADPSNAEERNDFLRYLEDVRKLLIVGAREGSLIITVQCSSQQILEELWEDYRTGYLNEMAQQFLVTEDIMKAFGQIDVRLTTTIEEKDYQACKEYFLRQSGECDRMQPGNACYSF